MSLDKLFYLRTVPLSSNKKILKIAAAIRTIALSILNLVQEFPILIRRDVSLRGTKRNDKSEDLKHTSYLPCYLYIKYNR